MKLGAQLYTVREHCQNLDDFSATLKKVADIGYKYVQVSGTCEFPAEWLKQELQKNGLECVLTHDIRDQIENETQKLIDEHKIYDCDTIGIGWYTIHETGIDEFEGKYRKAAELIKKSGLKLAYHNHDHEFIKDESGKTYIEQLCERFSEDELGLIVDTYWVQAAGGDPADFIDKNASRIKHVHLKDMGYKGMMLPVGSGNINFERILEVCQKHGIEHMIVEQDNSNGEDPFECLKKSYDYLMATGLF